MATNILMPALSPTMTEGNLARWLKQEGDRITLLAVDQPTLSYVLIGHASGELAGSTSELQDDGCCLLGRIHICNQNAPCK